MQSAIIEKKLKFFIVDAYEVADKTGMGGRINTIMQTCFFAISGVLPKDEAIAEIKKYIKKTYGKRGEAVVNQNFAAVDASLANLYEVKVPATATSTLTRRPGSTRCGPCLCQRGAGRHHLQRRRRPACQQDPQ